MVPPLAFFSWASASFYLLNLVVIPERTKKKKYIYIYIYIYVKRERRKKKTKRKKRLLFFTTSKFFQTLVDGSRPKK